MTRKTSCLEAEREDVENALMGLRRALDDLELHQLKVKQARKRTGLSELLDPGEVGAITALLAPAQQVLINIWQERYSKS